MRQSVYHLINESYLSNESSQNIISATSVLLSIIFINVLNQKINYKSLNQKINEIPNLNVEKIRYDGLVEAFSSLSALERNYGFTDKLSSELKLNEILSFIKEISIANKLYFISDDLIISDGGVKDKTLKNVFHFRLGLQDIKAIVSFTLNNLITLQEKIFDLERKSQIIKKRLEGISTIHHWFSVEDYYLDEKNREVIIVGFGKKVGKDSDRYYLYHFELNETFSNLISSNIPEYYLEEKLIQISIPNL